MYTELDLMKYEYFYNVLEKDRIEYVLEPLTKVINKGHLMPFIDSLIKDNVPFTLGVIDLDNFKFIVDNYGHSVGDEIICSIADDLVNFIGENGIVGRFGGDEFIFIYFDLVDYTEIHNMLSSLYAKVLRKSVKVSKLSIYITGTTGCAVYPKNASTTKELFELADKTLFRGKMKGRNCYIIYVEEKHKDLMVAPLIANDVFKLIFGVKEKFLTKTLTTMDKINDVADYINNSLNIPTVLYFDNSGSIYSTELKNNIGKLGTRIELDEFNLFEAESKIDFKNPIELYDLLVNFNIESLILTDINSKDKFKGYIAFADKKNRIWTPQEKTALFFFAELLSHE